MSATTATIPRPSALATLRGYVALTKPRIISLLLITTVPAMIAAEGGWPSTWLVVATLIGGTLSAGGANVVNCWYDRDIDEIMTRTRTRPTVTGEISPPNALTFGIGLVVVAFVFLWATTTLAAALLAVAAFLFYVFIYTIWLKRRTPQNIVIGGAAGAFPPMVGWAAVSGDITIASLLMFAVIFFWTPPHFWALALRLNDDYARAGVPMLPVTNGPAYTRTQILLYSVLLVGITFALGPAADLSWIYYVSAGALGSGFILGAYTLWSKPETVAPITLYKFSLAYLGLLFIAIGVDALVL